LFPDSTKKLSESGIIKMLNFLSDKIFALFGGPTRKLLKQGVIVVKLKSSLRMLSGCQHDLIKRYGISGSQMIIQWNLCNQTPEFSDIL
jgi:hypothetical protein